MVELYKALGEHGVVMSVGCYNEYNMVHFRFDKSGIYRVFAYTYETASDPKQLECLLLSHLGDFMFIYEQECIKRNRADILRKGFNRKYRRYLL